MDHLCDAVFRNDSQLFRPTGFVINMPNKDSKSPVYQNLEQKLKIQFDKKPKLYWIGIGKTDFLYQANKDYRKLLDEKGYKYTYRESDGGHIWKNWRIYLSEYAPLLFK